MRRGLTVLMLIVAAIVCAGCSSLAILRQRSEYRGFLEDWGVNKPRNVWIYAPVLAVLMCFCGTGCDLMEGLHQTNPNYRRPVPFSSNWWERREERLRR